MHRAREGTGFAPTRTAAAPAPHLQVLPHPLLVEALGQDHQPPLQLEPQRHLGRGPPALVRDGLDHGVLQENREVLAYPGGGGGTETLRV